MPSNSAAFVTVSLDRTTAATSALSGSSTVSSVAESVWAMRSQGSMPSRAFCRSRELAPGLSLPSSAFSAPPRPPAKLSPTCSSVSTNSPTTALSVSRSTSRIWAMVSVRVVCISSGREESLTSAPSAINSRTRIAAFCLPVSAGIFRPEGAWACVGGGSAAAAASASKEKGASSWVMAIPFCWASG